MENFRSKWNLDHITVTEILKFRTNWCRKWRKTFKIEKFVVLAEYFEQQTDCNRYRRKEANQGENIRGEESVIFTFPYQTNGNNAMELSAAGHVILRTALKRYSQFPWNCKQLRFEARNSMLNCEIYFPIFSETIYTYKSENIFTAQS